MKDKIIVIVFILIVALLYYYGVINAIVIVSGLVGAVVIELYKALKKNKKEN